MGKDKNKKGCGCFTLIVLALVVGSCGLLFGNNDKDDKSNSARTTTEVTVEATTEITTEATTQAATEASKKTTEAPKDDWSLDDQYDTYIAAVTPTLEEHYKDSYTIEKKDGMVVLNVWQDGLAAGAAYAGSGNEEVKDSWDNMESNVAGFAKSCYEAMVNMGIKDGHVNVNVLNDINKDNVLLTYLDGTCIYNAVD